MFKFSNLLNLFKKRNKVTETKTNDIELYDIAENIPKLEVIEEIDINDIIGKKIVDLQYRYQLLVWVDYFETFLTLDNGKVISLPSPNSDKVLIVRLPEKTEKFNKETEAKIIGQRILNLPIESEKDGFLTEYSSFIRLDNGYYLRESNMSPQGTGLAALYIVSTEDYNLQYKTDEQNKSKNKNNNDFKEIEVFDREPLF